MTSTTTNHQDISEIVTTLTSEDILKISYVKDSNVKTFIGTYLPPIEHPKISEPNEKAIILQNAWSDSDNTHHLVTKKIYYADIEKIEVLIPSQTYNKNSKVLEK